MKRTVYTEEHEAFRSVIRDFVAREVTPHFAQWEAARRTPREIFHKLGALGVLGFGIPEEYGGPGETSFKYEAILAEECALADGVSFAHYTINTSIALPYLLNLGTEEQKQRWLPGVASGEICLCLAMTEPGTGSDVAGIRTKAVLSDDGTHYVVNGSKTFITGALNSELCIAAVRTSPATPEDRRAGLTLLVIPTNSEGFSYGKQLEKIGLHARDTSELHFTDVRVPVENVLGGIGKGLSYLGQNLPRERLSIAVNAIAGAAAAVRFATAYVKERTVFGQSLASFQNSKFVLAECETEVAAAQAMADRGMELEDAGELTPADAAAIKLHCTDVAGRVIDKCLQLHGGYGYMTEYPIARLYCDTRVSRIYGGTNEVMKTIVAKDLGL